MILLQYNAIHPSVDWSWVVTQSFATPHTLILSTGNRTIAPISPRPVTTINYNIKEEANLKPAIVLRWFLLEYILKYLETIAPLYNKGVARGVLACP